MQLLWWRNFLDHNTGDGLPSSVSVTAAFETTAVSNHQSNTYVSFANPLTVSPNLAMFVNVGVLSAVICMDGIKAFDGDWFGTFRTIEGEKPALAATQAASDPEIAIKLDLQCCLVIFFDKDAILQKQKNKNKNKTKTKIYIYIY